MTIAPIIFASIAPTLIATLVFFLFEKFTNNGFKIFRNISLVLMVISFVNPFMGIEGVTVGYALVLDIMHLVVVSSLLYFIGKAFKTAI